MAAVLHSRWPGIVLALCALGAGVVPWWIACGPAAFPGFAVSGAAPVADAIPFFESVEINPQSPQAKAHSATLAQLPDGSLVAAWYAGSGEGTADVAILMARSTDGRQWAPPQTAFDRESVIAQLRRHVVSLGNPLLLSDDSSRLGLLFVSIAAGRWSGSSLNLAWSEDGGETWGPARKLTSNPLGNLSALPRNPPAPLVGGGWAVPIYEEFLGKFPEILWLQPRGGDWVAAISRIEGGVYVMQPALVPLTRDRAAAFFRDFRPAQWMSAAWSDDAGRTWTRPAVTSLPNKDSGLCVVRLGDGSLLCAFNGEAPGKRENLRLAVSRDEGRTWKTVATLAEERGQEFSYPYMLRCKDGVIRMVYSARQTRIVYAQFNEAWLGKQEASAP